MHPLINDLSSIKDSELDTKINDLTRKYFVTSNFELRQQIVMVLESYKEELGNRKRIEYENMMKSRDKGLDKLINVS
jgi:hypothetical protein